MCLLEPSWIAGGQTIVCASTTWFSPGQTCETQLLKFIEDIFAATESGTSNYVIMMNVAKAFDRVNYSPLVHKLDHYRIRGSTDNWIANFLHVRKQAVVVNGAGSDYINVKSGVPQGRVLGPCLFLLYINDILLKISPPSRLRLSEWGTSFQPDKCSSFQLTRSHNRNPSYTVHGLKLETFSSTKYLRP